MSGTETIVQGFLLAFALVVILMPGFLRLLRHLGFGKRIRVDGPQSHYVKEGTPTMGGFLILTACIGSTLLWADLTNGYVWVVIFATTGFGIVGFFDDFKKLTKRSHSGVSGRQRLLAEFLIGAVAAACVIWIARPPLEAAFAVPFFKNVLLQLGWFFVPVAAFVIVGASNAVNLTDGLDGLAAGSSTFAFSAFAIIGFWQFRHRDVYQVSQALDLAVLAVALTGACAGFLWWNAAPARIFMGDTGSLAIGAGLAAFALVMNLHLLLPVIGGLYVLVTLSVIVQVASFQLFHRRVFRMAPIHHHFELAGWPEVTVIVRFWILSGLCTALALGIFYADFISLGGLD